MLKMRIGFNIPGQHVLCGTTFTPVSDMKVLDEYNMTGFYNTSRH